MRRTKSSTRWLKEHFSDPYVAKAKKEGYRSRAIYKLIELQEKHTIFVPGQTVVDLGAAPGSWSQYIAKIVGRKGLVIALDLLSFDPINNVTNLQGDFTEEDTYQELLALLNDKLVNCIVSDMLSNATGIKKVDQLKSIYLVECVVEFANKILVQDGSVLIKVLQGPGFEEIVKDLKTHFTSVATKKPKASRARSKEVYLFAKGFKGR